MSNINGFELSVKDYAAKREKTVQAVYQQMKRKENAAALEGHVFTKRIGNKNVKYLDEKAVEILDEASNGTPTVVYAKDLTEELQSVSQDLKLAQGKILYQEGRIDLLTEQLAQKEAELRALAAPQEQIEALKAQNGDLKAERDEQRDKTAGAEKRALEAISEAYRAKVYAKELETYLKLPKLVQLFTKRPVFKDLDEPAEKE